jgi:hypothetical protein
MSLSLYWCRYTGRNLAALALKAACKAKVELVSCVQIDPAGGKRSLSKLLPHIKFTHAPDFLVVRGLWQAESSN